METENQNITESKISAKDSNKISMPLAVVFAGILIAGAILYNKVEVKVENKGDTAPTVEQSSVSLDKVRKVSKSRDYIRGNPEADIFIIEYSDTECPFCKQLHSTLKQVIKDYENTGKVAWVYRHFPLEQLHSKARTEAIALECAGELGGPDKFWQYTDRLYDITPANNGLDLAELPKIAQYVGISVANFNECLESGRHNARIDEDLQNAIDTGGRGTPWSIVLTKTGEKYPLSGAMSYENIKQMIDSLLKN